MKPDKGTLNVLAIHDNKPGHLTQLEGLVMHLKKLHSVQALFKTSEQCKVSLLGQNKVVSFIPDIVIGAGHRTHKAVLKQSLRHKAFSTILMKPSLPVSFFNAVICPEHDKLRDNRKVLKTRGTINKIVPKTNSLERNMHLMLIGGPSKHYHWDEAELCKQIKAICLNNKTIRWTLSSSPRTPVSTLDKLAHEHLDNLDINAFNASTLEPIEQLLRNSVFTWVTPDSQSMIYESITAGNPTGILALPCTKHAKSRRIQQQTFRLFDDRLAIGFTDWQKKHTNVSTYFNQTNLPLNEADRAASWLLARYTESHS